MLSRHHQIALVDEPGGRVLVVPTPDGPRLPRFPGRWPDHRDLVAAVAAPAAFIGAPPWREDDGTVTNLLLGDTSHLEGAGWHPLTALDELGLSDGSCDGIRRALAERRDGPPRDGRAAWFLPGWRQAVDAWVDEQLPGLGLEHDGPAEVVKVWSLSAVLRYPVLRGGEKHEVWFKATCDGFHSEPALTEAIRRLAPDVAPRVLAVDGDRAWLLMEPIPNADDESHGPQAPAIARALAELQLGTLGTLGTLGAHDALRAAGAPDRGRDATAAWIRTVVRETVEQQYMTEAQRAGALGMEEWLVDSVEALWAFGLPDVLTHGDLHLGNVAWTGDGPLFFDWTDACLSHPMLDVRHLAESAVDYLKVEGDAARAVEREVLEAWAEPWRAAFPDVDLDGAWRASEVVEHVFQAISYEQIYRAQPESQRWELATIVVETLDKLAALRPAADVREVATGR
ncbi:aminoglycoside phosphotransferase family protein [Nocardioides sp. GCM10027113]|uniref:aminoglycoside phosphotransferase family protein n=1 Tax=unclassified Nocardioides TaxID=2615069 RepID=UPI00361E2893